MKKIVFVFTVCLLAINLSGCATLQQMTQSAEKADNNADAAPLSSYSGPKARVAVADFDVKAAKATNQIGSGLREMMVTAMVNSSRFTVLERQQLKALMQEQGSSAAGTADNPAKTSELIITASVVEFEPQGFGGSDGIGGGGGVGSGMLGGLLGGALNKSHMALDIRIVDASTSEVLAVTRVQGQATDVNAGALTGFFGGWNLGAGLSGYAKTPMEKAIRICIIEAIRYIAQTIPAEYYKY